MDALLEELCARYGWCLRPENHGDVLAAGAQGRGAIIDSIIRAEFGDVGLDDAQQRERLGSIVDDWLYDPDGRGARSGLPR